MSQSKKIKSLSKKIAASLIKNEISNDLEKSEIFDKKTKEQMLLDIKKGERLSLLQKADTEKDWKSLKRKLKRSRKGSVYWKYGAAASVLIIVTLTIFLNRERDTPFSESLIVNNNIKVGSDIAILTLADGSDITLEKGTTYQTDHVTSNGEEITYNNNNTSQQLVNNYLTIPRGGQFQLTLSDGTQVWLNSESQLKYPVSFTDGESRQVELVYGEAYFDVSPSTEHDGSDFKVYHQEQEIQVLGTEFNIKAYKGETNIYTTLVEGKVAINVVDKNQILVPNQQSNLNIQSNSLTIATVDVYMETAWKEGIFEFKKMPLKDIMSVLSRWYDMEVVFENKNFEESVFTGTLLKSQAIEEILLDLKNINFINDFEIHNKVLIIK